MTREEGDLLKSSGRVPIQAATGHGAALVELENR